MSHFTDKGAEGLERLGDRVRKWQRGLGGSWPSAPTAVIHTPHPV